MTRDFTEAELESYLDEALSPKEMAEIEELLRQRPELTEQLKAIHGRRDAGIHSLGEIWRRHRVSCPDRELLGSYLLNVLDGEEQDHIRFHLETIGCRLCNANLQDLQEQQKEAERATQDRRRRYFQSSAGYLHGDE